MVPKTSESARLTRLMFHITTITSKINGCLLGTRWVHKMTTGSWSIGGGGGGAFVTVA